MAILLGVAAAAGWGASDYFGGDASRRDTPVLVIVAVAELLGVVLLIPVLMVRGSAPPGDPRLLLAGLAGVAVTVELSLIYKALGRGHAFITAPTGALGAAVAVSAGLLGGDPVDLTLGIGLICALAGAGISAWTSPGAARAGGGSGRATTWTLFGASAAVGTMLTTLHAAGRLDPYWATALEHVGTAISAGLLALISTRRSAPFALPDRLQMRTLALIAAVGVGGDLAYAAAARHGALSIVSATSSLYPLTTIGLGRLLESQRPTRVQLSGIALALVGAVVLGAASR
jgi:drug/metabolite transporter (DMT)-like permease